MTFSAFPANITSRWMPQHLTDDKLTSVQVIAWCRQVTSHYLSQCWPKPMSPYGVSRPRRVNSLVPGRSEYDVKNAMSIFFNQLLFSSLLTIIPSDDCHRTLLMISQPGSGTSHYLSQCWSTGSSMSPDNGVTKPQWVNPYHVGTWFNIVNIMVADTLAPCVARTSEPMILTM